MQGNRLVEPRQARSRATLERFEAAAIALLEDRSWDELTLVDLVSFAHSSVGAFYSRFADKRALLEYLDERYTAQMIGLMRKLERRSASDLRSAIDLLVKELISFHRRRRGLIRALVLYARRHREVAWDQRTREMNDALSRLLKWLARHRDEIRHPRAERAVFFAFAFTFTALRDRMLFPESIVDPAKNDDAALADELAHLMWAYLLTPPFAAGTPRGFDSR